MKYIIFELQESGVEIPVIFPEAVDHASMVIPTMFWGGIKQTAKPVSAGFTKIVAGVFACYGESVGLKLNSRFRDFKILREAI